MIRSSLAIAIAGWIALASPALAQPSVPIMKLLPSDGAAGEEFGVSIAISGDKALIGALSGGDNGDLTGSAYVFNLNTGKQVIELLPDDGAATDGFGFHTDLHGSTAMIGAASNDESGHQTGAAYLVDVTNGHQIAKFLAADASVRDFFGSDVAFDGNTALIGSIFGDGAVEDSGAAYLIDTVSGQLIQKLIVEGGEPNDYFGTSVAISETAAVVGASGVDNADSRYGSVYVFDTATGELSYELNAELGEGFARFGNSVSIGGEHLLVSSPYDTENGRDSGAVFVFDLVTGSLIWKLSPDDSAPYDVFGTSISISGRLVAVSSVTNYEKMDCDCRVYLFDALTGRQVLRIRHEQSESHELFGYPIELSGTKLLVGAIRDDDNGVDAGAVYLYDISACLADVNLDRIVDAADLGIVLSAFGSDDPAADINGDGRVDTADLGMLIRSFGLACE